MINKILFATLLTSVVSASITNNASNVTWVTETGTKVTDIENGHKFVSHNRNDSAKTGSKVKLDRLTFNFKMVDAKKDQISGFYFNTDDSHDLDKNTCTFTFAPKIQGDGAQTRFGIYKTDDTTHWFDGGALPLNQIGVVGKLGFGLDNTLVLDSSKELNLSFSFKKVGPFYKITIKELSEGLIWVNNANYVSSVDGNYVYTYVEASSIKTDNDYVTVHEFGYSTDKSEQITHITNFEEKVQENVNVTYHYNYYKTEGDKKIPVVDTKTVAINGKIPKMNDPVNDGYYFAGWYIDEFFVTKWDFDKNVATDDMNLYAKWTTEDPNNPDTGGKIKNTVIQISVTLFAILCVVFAIILVGLGILVYWLIKKIKLKKRGNDLLK